MSLLLEALNRLESERKQRDARHGLLSMPAPLPETTHPGEHSLPPQARQPEAVTVINTGSHGSWIIIILCFNALLFVVVGFFWIQLQNQKNNNDAMLFSYLMKQPPAELGQTVARDDELAQLVVAAAENNRAVMNTDRQKTPGSQDAAVVALDKQEVDGVAVDQGNFGKQQKETTVRIQPKREAVASVQLSASPLSFENDGTYQLRDLPADLSSQFPQLRYNAHLYSPDLPSARMIMVNDKKYSEKDYLQKDLQIDQITPEGVIYKFKQVKLSVNVVSELQ